MNKIKTIIQANQTVFVFLALAFLFDLYNAYMNPVVDDFFATPSILVVIYCLGIALLIRLRIIKRKVNIVMTWLVILFLNAGWFIVMTGLTNGEPYRPTILFILCLFCAFATLRYDEKKVTDKPLGSDADNSEEAE